MHIWLWKGWSASFTVQTVETCLLEQKTRTHPLPLMCASIIFLKQWHFSWVTFYHPTIFQCNKNVTNDFFLFLHNFRFCGRLNTYYLVYVLIFIQNSDENFASSGFITIYIQEMQISRLYDISIGHPECDRIELYLHHNESCTVDACKCNDFLISCSLYNWNNQCQVL